VKTGTASSSERDLDQTLALEKDKYNEARRLAGLEPLK
jgi:hypothetical protein